MQNGEQNDCKDSSLGLKRKREVPQQPYQQQDHQIPPNKKRRKQQKKQKKVKKQKKIKLQELDQQQTIDRQQRSKKKKKTKSKKKQSQKQQQLLQENKSQIQPSIQNLQSLEKIKKNKKSKKNKNIDKIRIQELTITEQESIAKKSKNKKKKTSIKQQSIQENVDQNQEDNKDIQKESVKEKSISQVNLLKKKSDKTETINNQNRQLARQCVTKRSNFYLQKIQNLKQGLPVGRGSKKAVQKIEQQKRKRLNESKKKSKKVNKQVKQQEVDKNESNKKKKQKDQCTKEQSIRIIKLYAIDAGDYKGMIKQLPDIPLAKLRGHLRMLFERCLQIITKRVQESGRKINDWELAQKRQIVRQLHRIRSTNRLLSQQNVEFREKFLKLMMNYHDSSLNLTENDFNYLYRKIEAFVRGFCSLGISKKKNEVKFEETFDQNRLPLLEGGYIMDRNRVKREVKIQEKLEQKEETKKVDPEKLIFEWTEEQEKQLGKFYICHQANTQAIHEQLKIKFGFKNHWKDFQLINKKIDSLVKKALHRLQQLTTRPYNREQRIQEDKDRQKQVNNQRDPNTQKKGISSLDLMTKFIYNNKKVIVSKNNESSEGVFKNLPLLQRQIFGHVESFKSRFALIKLLFEKYPPEEDVNDAIKVIKQFVAYAIEWEKKNRIILLKQAPVIEDMNNQPLTTKNTQNSQNNTEQRNISENQKPVKQQLLLLGKEESDSSSNIDPSEIQDINFEQDDKLDDLVKQH